jgi:D-glycero-beta-D-manno-heptose-7-phosphate kinase
MNVPQLTIEDIEVIFDDLQNKNVLIIGDVMVDSYWWGNVNRISPEAPVPVVLLNKREYRLGGAANVAMNVKMLGAKPILCSIIGNDADGTLFMDLLKDASIKGEYILKIKDRPTTVKTRIMGNGIQQLIRIDSETEVEPNAKDKSLLLELILTALPDADVVIFQDYDKGLITDDLISHIVEEARTKNIPTIVDPKKKNFHHYKHVSLFKPNLKELKDGLNISVEKPISLENLDIAANKVFDQMNVDRLMITLSEDGVYINDHNEGLIIKSHKRNIFDVSGAGDTVVSVAALALASDLEPALIAELSNIAGGLVCEKVGVVPIERSSFMQECKRLLIHL